MTQNLHKIKLILKLTILKAMKLFQTVKQIAEEPKK
jgi:hypothetical protein